MGKAWKKKKIPPPPQEISGCRCSPPVVPVPAENQLVVPTPAVAPVPIMNQLPVQAPVLESTTSASLKNDTFLEKLLETMRSLKETQERQGEKLEALMNSQRNTAANLSA